jgi:hypothetical protein
VARQLVEQPQALSAKVQAPASIAGACRVCRASTANSIEVDVLQENPVTNVKRPRVATDSMTVSLTRHELEQLLDAAEAGGPVPTR